jgi:site-specific recombinase XerC
MTMNLLYIRHSFPTHLLESSSEIRTVQELLGYRYVTTTMIYAHASIKGQRVSAVRLTGCEKINGAGMTMD